MPNQNRLGLLAQAGLEPYQEKPGEEYMNEAQRVHFKTILETWRNDLRNEVDSVLNRICKMKLLTFLIQLTVLRKKKSSL